MFTQKRYSSNYVAGFTVTELIVVMVIIGILSGLAINFIDSYRYSSRNVERVSDTESIARAFEISYLRDTTLNGPSYPTTQGATTVSGYSSLFKNQSLDVTKAPETTADTSIVAATSANMAQSPTKDQYIYLPLTASGSLCSGTELCVRFRLYYRLEGENTVKVIESIHQQ